MECDCVRECFNCVYGDREITDYPCGICVKDSGFTCRQCEEQTRFERLKEEEVGL